jgi:opacity protein-like surface antigen
MNTTQQLLCIMAAMISLTTANASKNEMSAFGRLGGSITFFNDDTPIKISKSIAKRQYRSIKVGDDVVSLYDISSTNTYVDQDGYKWTINSSGNLEKDDPATQVSTIGLPIVQSFISDELSIDYTPENESLPYSYFISLGLQWDAFRFLMDYQYTDAEFSLIPVDPPSQKTAWLDTTTSIHGGTATDKTYAIRTLGTSTDSVMMSTENKRFSAIVEYVVPLDSIMNGYVGVGVTRADITLTPTATDYQAAQVQHELDPLYGFVVHAGITQPVTQVVSLFTQLSYQYTSDLSITFDKIDNTSFSMDLESISVSIGLQLF